MNAAIIIPIWKIEITKNESISLDSVRRFLGNHQIIFAAPAGFSPSYLMPGERLLYFNPHYFSGIDGYNELLTSALFYQSFEEFDYILIAQLDTFVFKNELTEWCKKEYDYIGAPWTYEISNYVCSKQYLPLLHKTRCLKLLRKFTRTEYLVGNGGFSLRKVNTFIHFLSKYKFEIEQYKKEMQPWKSTGCETALHEDIFWTLYVPLRYRGFNVAPFKDALNFAFEVNPHYCYKKNHHQLPFGCHAWEKHGIDFWRPLMKNYGYDV